MTAAMEATSTSKWVQSIRTKSRKVTGLVSHFCDRDSNRFHDCIRRVDGANRHGSDGYNLRGFYGFERGCSARDISICKWNMIIKLSGGELDTSISSAQSNDSGIS